jgi:hypothetical protein
VQGIEIFYVSEKINDSTSVIELEVRGQVMESIVGTKVIDDSGNVTYSRYFDMDGSGTWGELKTTGSETTETIISSKEYQNLLKNIEDGAFDFAVSDYPNLSKDQLFDRMVFGNCGMYPYRIHDSLGQSEIDHFIVYGYARFKFNYYTSSFSFLDWTEFTESGNVKILADDIVELNDDSNPTEIRILSNGITTAHKLAPRTAAYKSTWGLQNCVCIGNKAPWTDTKAAAKEQKTEMKENQLSSDEALLYRIVSDIING